MFGRFKKNVDNDTRSGLSIDDSRIAFARVQKLNSGKLQLAALTFEGAEINEKWAQQLARRMDNIDPTRSQVTSVLPDGSYQLLLVDIPNVPADEVNSAARWQIKDLLDYPADDTIVEMFEMPQVSAGEKKPMAYAVATRRSSIQEHIELLHGAGFSLNVIDIPELCTRNIATRLPQDDDGVAFLHFTESHGILTVTRQGVLYLIRRIEKGRRDINAGAQDFVIQTPTGTVPDLEIPVLEVQGSAGDDESQSAATDDFTRMEMENTIVLEIQRSLDYYESHFFGRALTELVLAPGSDIGGLSSKLSEQLGLTVSSLDFHKLFEMQSELMPAEQGACLLAVGAALRSESLAA